MGNRRSSISHSSHVVGGTRAAPRSSLRAVDAPYEGFLTALSTGDPVTPVRMKTEHKVLIGVLVRTRRYFLGVRVESTGSSNRRFCNRPRPCRVSSPHRLPGSRRPPASHAIVRILRGPQGRAIPSLKRHRHLTFTLRHVDRSRRRPVHQARRSTEQDSYEGSLK
jgi:hypothetical protein